MAVIERIGKPESRPYVVAWGRLTEEDEGRLLARVLTSRHVDVTFDLCEIEEVTDEGCSAIKNVAEYMGQDQTMVVLYIPDREATRSLERSGIADDGRIVLVASSPSRRSRGLTRAETPFSSLRAAACRRPGPLLAVEP
jgi:hypothetical protein